MKDGDKLVIDLNINAMKILTERAMDRMQDAAIERDKRFRLWLWAERNAD